MNSRPPTPWLYTFYFGFSLTHAKRPGKKIRSVSQTVPITVLKCGFCYYGGRVKPNGREKIAMGRMDCYTPREGMLGGGSTWGGQGQREQGELWATAFILVSGRRNRGGVGGEAGKVSDWLGWLISPAMARRGCPESSGACS